MKFPARCAIHKIQPKGFVLIEDGKLIGASDALIVEVPFEGPAPERAAVESKSLGHALKGRGVRNPIARIDYEDDVLTAVAGDGSLLTLDQQSQLAYPRAQQVPEPREYVTVRFSAQLLAMAAAAMGTDAVEIRVPVGEPIVTQPLTILPCDALKDGGDPLTGAKAVLGVHT